MNAIPHLAIAIPEEAEFSSAQSQEENGNQSERHQVKQGWLGSCHQVEAGKSDHQTQTVCWTVKTELIRKNVDVSNRSSVEAQLINPQQGHYSLDNI